LTDEKAARGDDLCPSDDRFLDFFLEKKCGPGAEALLDHLHNCPDCRAKFGLLRELDPVLRAQFPRLRPLARASRRELRNRERRPGEAGKRGRFRFLAAAGSAAALLLAVFVLPGLPPRGNDALERGGMADNMALPSGLMTEPPLLFVWTPPPGGDGYRFELIDESLGLLASFSTKAPWILIPVAVRDSLAPGQTYLWTVEAVNDDGVKIGFWRHHFELK
jgi:hypothetical protein